MATYDGPVVRLHERMAFRQAWLAIVLGLWCMISIPLDFLWLPGVVLATLEYFIPTVTFTGACMYFWTAYKSPLRRVLTVLIGTSMLCISFVLVCVYHY